ncbi:putative amidohydrolase [Actinoplanes lutulentus]|uniref:Putative amidohydrolase n=1 Tax=Actinoplanes lutulentus TaxID=1287878 RepID=A0A327Z5R4_9ACTN|nr:carbon-nitrogen hydrolase family protein [Actinoplanes lutulentus]MBB2946996.1 putative amidohydrolase [Actinoplanes lutulentus]RAK30498.1 putative amidohydrolase [Actinoplanes lutulentus]
MTTLRVAACQTPEILGDPEAALTYIEDFARRTDADLLLFPECFLQGYLVDPAHVIHHAINLESARFATIRKRLEPIGPTLVFGMIEEDAGDYFNSVVVVTRGRLEGRYRKTCLMPGESVFTPGTEYPTFKINGIRYGISICSDTQHPEPAAHVAAQGARMLLVSAQNMMRRPTAERWKDEHHRMRIERARETGMWLVSSDVTGTRGEDRIGYGPTSVISPTGVVVTQVPLLTTGTAIAELFGDDEAQGFR